ncbi:hypothetical protein D9M68_511910 [compost metagenome]
MAAYYTGSVTSFAALLTALQSACTDNGWVLDSGILSKGAAFVKLATVTHGITVQGGTSQSGATLNGASPQTPRLGKIHNSLGAQAVWPMTYHIHLGTAPEEVYCIVRHNVDYFWWLAFGVSDVVGLPGTGLWLGANAKLAPETYTGGAFTNGGVWMNSAGSGGDTYQGGVTATGALFWKTNNINAANSQNTVHSNLDGNAWADTATDSSVTAAGRLQAPIFIQQLLDRSPSAWNNEAVLLPIQAYLTRASSKASLVVDLRHARYVRVDNYDPEQIITLGPDRWKVYPFYRKNVARRDGQVGGGLIDDTGTFGWAIRYDGP